MRVLGIVLESARTTALVLLALAVSWTALHGVTVHHDGQIHAALEGSLPFSGIDINVH